jgi:hypothetical protein
MNTSRQIPKLNAKTGLIVTSILYLVNIGVGTAIAVNENLPSETFMTSGKPALEDFLAGNGTALSPPLYGSNADAAIIGLSNDSTGQISCRALSTGSGGATPGRQGNDE